MNILSKKKSSPLTKCNSKSRLLSPKTKATDIESRQMTPKLENKKLAQRSEPEEFCDLISTPNDDIKSLIKKNAKLRTLLLKNSNQMVKFTKSEPKNKPKRRRI
jgi:hypothetical protein